MNTTRCVAIQSATVCGEATTRVLRCISLLLLWPLACALPSIASATNYAQLASNPVWLTLLHYESTRFPAGYKSAVTSADFFLADDGATSPLSELRATVQALSNPLTALDNSNNSAAANAHAQCRFPARHKWLATQIKPLSVIPQINCTDYLAWAELDAVKSLSMVFAAGHMKSPASYFGHNFLKFNRKSDSASNHLLDQTINFGAEVPDNESGITYFYHGVFGGYSALFERQQFFRHMNKYGEEDLRDVWEYELQLTPEQVELIVAHTWELQNRKFTYYFFRENCAYQIALLLKLTTPDRLVPKHMPWTMPYNVFDKLMLAGKDSGGLVREIKYHPSRRSRFHQRYFSLSSTQRGIAVELINGELSPDAPRFRQLDADLQLQVIDTLIDYYEFRQRIDTSDEKAKAEKNALLLKRFDYPPAAASSIEARIPYAPHESQKPGYLNIARVHSSKLGFSTRLKIRPAYFDFLSLDIGRSSAGSFTVLDTTVQVSNETAYLQKLDVFNITNLSASVTGLPGDSSLSWHFRFAFDQTNNACSKCRKPMLDLTVGRALKLGDRLTAFALAGGRVQKSYQRDNTFAVQLRAGLTGQLTDLLRLNASIERHEDTGANGLDRNRTRLELRLGQHKSWDIRASYIRDIAEQISLSAGYYW